MLGNLNRWDLQEVGGWIGVYWFGLNRGKMKF